MRSGRLLPLVIGAVLAAMGVWVAATHSGTPSPPWFTWSTVVNNNDLMPPLAQRAFNSYNTPSVNANGMVVFRARSKGMPAAGSPTHGIYTRNMGGGGGAIVRILDRTSQVPAPNNLSTTFIETPAFPRIDIWSNTVVTRGNHQPVWEYTVGADHTRTGTTGIYTNPYGGLVTGASKLGDVPGYDFFEVPEAPGTRFEVFPGPPSVTDGATIVFKGNYVANSVARAGVYYRDLASGAAGGSSPVVLIANTSTLMPGTGAAFGSVSPPTAAGRMVVFSGFDNEQNPGRGGIYLAPLSGPSPSLTTVIAIGQRVPGESNSAVFSRVGEGAAFDGRYLGFWGSWGAETRSVRLYCPTEGNQDRIDYCNRQLVCADTGQTVGDPGSVCNDTSDPNYPICYQVRRVPVNQGVFIQDVETGVFRTVAKTGAQFKDFLFWNYSGMVPCRSSGHGSEGGEDDGEPARWRSSAFVAVAGQGEEPVYTAFKAVSRDAVGIYLGRWPGQAVFTVLDTNTDGQDVDPEAPAGSTVTEVGLEREGLRGSWLAVTARMGVPGGSEEDGMAGIYITHIPPMP